MNFVHVFGPEGITTIFTAAPTTLTCFGSHGPWLLTLHLSKFVTWFSSRFPSCFAYYVFFLNYPSIRISYRPRSCYVPNSPQPSWHEYRSYVSSSLSVTLSLVCPITEFLLTQTYRLTQSQCSTLRAKSLSTKSIYEFPSNSHPDVAK